MKNLKLLFGILISTFVLSCSSDDSGGGDNQQLNTKLPKKITSVVVSSEIPDPNPTIYSYEFSYNSDNTIREIIHKQDGESDWTWKFYYENGIPIQSKLLYGGEYTIEYIYEAGRLVHEKYNNIYDSDYVNFGYFYTNGKLDYAGFVDSEGYFYYDFDSNDNIIQEEDSTGLTVFTYDNKKNPFINLHSNMKKIFVCNKIAEELGITYYGELDLFLNTNKNNIIKINRYNNNSTSYEYVYENEYDDEGYLLKTTRPGVFNYIYTFEYYE